MISLKGSVKSLHEQLSNMSVNMENQMHTIWSALDASHDQIDGMVVQYANQFLKFGNAVSYQLTH